MNCFMAKGSLDGSIVGEFAGRSALFAVGGQERVGEAVWNAEEASYADGFGGEFGKEVVGGEVEQLQVEALLGVGKVVETVGVHGHGDAAGGKGSGEVAKGDAAVSGIGGVGDGKGECVEETTAVVWAMGGVVTRIVAQDGVGGEATDAGGGVEGEVGGVVAGKAADAFVPLGWISARRKFHPGTGLNGGNEEVCRAEGELFVEDNALTEGEGAGGSGLNRGGRNEIRLGMGAWSQGESGEQGERAEMRRYEHVTGQLSYPEVGLGANSLRGRRDRLASYRHGIRKRSTLSGQKRAGRRIGRCADWVAAESRLLRYTPGGFHHAILREDTK